VRKHLVRFVDLLETGFSGGIALVYIGVMLASQTTVGTLDVVRRCRGAEPQHLIVITFDGQWNPLLHLFRTDAGGWTRALALFRRQGEHLPTGDLFQCDSEGVTGAAPHERRQALFELPGTFRRQDNQRILAADTLFKPVCGWDD